LVTSPLDNVLLVGLSIQPQSKLSKFMIVSILEIF